MTDDLRTPPANIEAEACVLGSMILSPRAIHPAREMLTAGDFYRPAHGALFAAILALNASGSPVDLVTIKNTLNQANTMHTVGGIEYVVALAEGTPSAGNVEYYAGLVADRAKLRAIIMLADQVRGDAYRPDATAAEVLRDLETATLQLRPQATGVQSMQLAAAAQTALAESQAISDGLPPAGVPTGIPSLDRVLTTLRPGGLYTLAAATGVGKSSLATCIARCVALNGGAVQFVSAEMGCVEVAHRFLTIHAKLDGEHITAGKLSESEWRRANQAAGDFAGWHLHIEGNRVWTPSEIATSCRRLALDWNRPLDLVVVDYLQLLRPPAERGMSREQKVSHMAWELKALAGDLNVPVLMLSQFSRAFEKEHRLPELSDLRESGAIEQHSNAVILLHVEPEDLGIDDGAHNIWVKVAKHRGGPTTSWPKRDGFEREAIKLRFTPQQTRFAMGDDYVQ